MKKSFALTVIIALSVLLALTAFADGDPIFTLQPYGGQTTLGKTFTITWKTSDDCRYLLQTREDDTYDWGNIDYVTYPYTFSEYTFEYSAQYRIMAVRESDGKEFYSDVITVSWVPADNLTEVEMTNVVFDDLPLGYTEIPSLPIIFRNVGAYDLENPRVEMGYGSDEFFDIIECSAPVNTPAGSSDGETWKIAPKKGLGVGEYHELFYLFADNLAEPASASVDFCVTESDVDITYEIEANDVDFGILREGYGEQNDITIEVRAVGTGNLTKVHIKTDGQDSFFKLHQNSLQIDSLPAGTGSKTNWYAVLDGGLQPGDYSAELLVYAAETEQPYKVTVKVKIIGANDPMPQNESGSDKDADDNKADDNKENGGFPWVIVAVIAAIVFASVVAFIVVKKKDR